MMLRLSLVFSLAVCVSADSTVLSSINDQVTSIASNISDDVLAVTRFFTISRITSTILVSKTATTSIFPTCTTATVDTCQPLAMGRRLNFEVLSPTKPEEIEITASPSLARIDLSAEHVEEDNFESGHLIFSSQEGADCFGPKERFLADFVTFITSTTATTTVTTTETDTSTTVSIIYDGCVPSDALSTTKCT